MTPVYIVAVLIGIHIVWAFLNIVAFKDTFFIRSYTKYLLGLLNWLVPLIGPVVVHLCIKSSYAAGNAGSPVKDSTGGSNLYSGNEGSGCGGNSD